MKFDQSFSALLHIFLRRHRLFLQAGLSSRHLHMQECIFCRPTASVAKFKVKYSKLSSDFSRDRDLILNSFDVKSFDEQPDGCD